MFLKGGLQLDDVTRWASRFQKVNTGLERYDRVWEIDLCVGFMVSFKSQKGVIGYFVSFLLVAG